jgi:hypothetical protein
MYLYSFFISGGRFCCNDGIQSATLDRPIVTHTNHALILFKTYAPGSAGFKAHISIGIYFYSSVEKYFSK